MTSPSKTAAFCPNVLAGSQAGNSLLMERKRTEASKRGWERVRGGGREEEGRKARGAEVASEDFGSAQLEPGRAAGKQIQHGVQVHPLQVATSGVL